jgi:hypothetical protein
MSFPRWSVYRFLLLGRFPEATSEVAFASAANAFENVTRNERIAVR